MLWASTVLCSLASTLHDKQPYPSPSHKTYPNWHWSVCTCVVTGSMMHA
ncbi:hypothetical protein BDA96_03G064100 [Sorghum bicolor]|uniref:Uncharacterized protein n=2 Tax=Sorghum bicolor TaxID=4558 RepID=A0A921ULE4_SORBI|nr:hypothetical protein BDA96_03G064100 [Sorghum bicolor]OQU86256.1 hypothetical protein SORBI_3003G059250 [Sorghum bicolor]